MSEIERMVGFWFGSLSENLMSIFVFIGERSKQIEGRFCGEESVALSHSPEYEAHVYLLHHVCR